MEISLHSRVRIQEDVLFQELQGEAVLLNLKTGVYLGLNPLGTRIWKLLQEDGALSKVKDAILQGTTKISTQSLQQALENRKELRSKFRRHIGR